MKKVIKGNEVSFQCSREDIFDYKESDNITDRVKKKVNYPDIFFFHSIISI